MVRKSFGLVRCLGQYSILALKFYVRTDSAIILRATVIESTEKPKTAALVL